MKYIVSEDDKFCKSIRKQALKSLSKESINSIDLDLFITLDQCRDIVYNCCAGQDPDGRCIIDEETYLDMLIEISEQIYQSALSKLAADNIIECAWDDEEGHMIFWINEEDGTKKKILSTLI